MHGIYILQSSSCISLSWDPVSTPRMGPPSSLEKPHHKCILPSTKSRASTLKITTHSSKQKQKATLETMRMGLKQALPLPLGSADRQSRFPTPQGQLWEETWDRTGVWQCGSCSEQQKEKSGVQKGWLSSCPHTPSCPWVLGLRAAPLNTRTKSPCLPSISTLTPAFAQWGLYVNQRLDAVSYSATWAHLLCCKGCVCCLGASPILVPQAHHLVGATVYELSKGWDVQLSLFSAL